MVWLRVREQSMCVWGWKEMKKKYGEGGEGSADLLEEGEGSCFIFICAEVYFVAIRFQFNPLYLKSRSTFLILFC